MTERNPLQTLPSMFAKINAINDEISEGLRNLSDEQRYKMDSEIDELKKLSVNDRSSPEAEFTLLLFRKYSDVANNIKDEKKHARTDGLLGDVSVPSYIYEGNVEQLSGWNATKKNIFWLRAGTAVFAFITYVVMATVPNITYSELDLHDAFTDECRYNHIKISGHFDNRPFQFVLYLAVLVYLHSLLFTLYYVLPIDDHNQKFIPGMDRILERCLGEQSRDVSGRCFDLCSKFSKFCEVVLDGILLLLTIISCLLAAIMLERGYRFDFGDLDGAASPQPIQYYTIGTFYNTFSHTYPICIDQDPCSKIRASLAMMFMTMIFLFLSLQVSVRSFQQELRIRSTQDGGKFSPVPLSPSSDHVGGSCMQPEKSYGNAENSEVVSFK